MLFRRNIPFCVITIQTHGFENNFFTGFKALDNGDNTYGLNTNA